MVLASWLKGLILLPHVRHHDTVPELRVDPGGWLPLQEVIAAGHIRRDGGKVCSANGQSLAQ